MKRKNEFLLKRAKGVEPYGPHSLQIRAIEDSREALMDAGDKIFSLVSGIASLNAKKAAALIVTVMAEHDHELSQLAEILKKAPCPRNKGYYMKD
jgi:hypothetical protein